MLDKKKKRRSLTDEQRKRIMETPGVVVHRRDPSKPCEPYRPKIWLDETIPIRELLGRDEGYDEDTRS